MLETALKILKEITSHSYKAYIVGGFVRDYLLGIESNDIDITTNATPKEIKEIFEDSCLPSEDYGSVVVIVKGIRFEITTFRREKEYVNHRKPVEIEYIDDLYDDLLRRDFVINTICMDENGNILDYLGGQRDLQDKMIRAVGNAYDRLSEDCLRILRAIRFATIFDFTLDEDIKDNIYKTKHLLSNLSYQRKREELDKIFTSTNCRKGIELLLQFGLDKELEIPNLAKVLDSGAVSLIAIWTILDVEDVYPFPKCELDLIHRVKEVLQYNINDPFTLYQYGLYVCSVAGEIEKQDIRMITEEYNQLIIKSRNDIDIDSETIMKILNKEPGRFLQDIYHDIENKILFHKLDNNKDLICKYILEQYS